MQARKNEWKYNCELNIMKFSPSLCTTLKFLIIAADLIKILIFQYPMMPKIHLRLLLEVLSEKLNHRVAINLNCR